MADSTVTALTAASTLGGTELFYCVQGGADRKATPAQLKTYAWTGNQTITGQFLVTAAGVTTVALDGSSWMTFAAPNTKAFMLSTFDDAGNLTRTWDQPTGRMDLLANSAAGQAAGCAMAIGFNNASPAIGDTLGHYAFRGRDTNANMNTNGWVLCRAKSVTPASLASYIELGVMVAVNAPGGNGQPNTAFSIDGSNATVTMPSAFNISASGNYSSTSSAGPSVTLTNSSNSQALAISASTTGIINATGGNGLSVQASGTEGINLTNTLVKLPITTQIVRSLRTSKTANYTLLLTDSGTHYDNAGAVGEVDFTLPASPLAGMVFRFNLRAAQILKIIAPSATFINHAGSQSSSAGNISMSTNGCSVEIECTNGNLWTTNFFTGTWTVA